VVGGARVHGLAPGRAHTCSEVEARSGSPAGGAGSLAIVYPADGARFLLDPTRSTAHQRPPLRAIPANGDVRWTINGVPADSWIPTRGTHVVQARLGDTERQIRVEFD
jgi:hypothetical protein